MDPSKRDSAGRVTNKNDRLSRPGVVARASDKSAAAVAVSISASN